MWAIGINLVVFVLLGVAFAKIPAPQARQATPKTPAIQNKVTGSPIQPLPIANPPSQPPVSQARTSPPPTKGQWINEFYLDRGPAISFAPRLNPDGSPRSLPRIRININLPHMKIRMCP